MPTRSTMVWKKRCERPCTIVGCRALCLQVGVRVTGMGHEALDRGAGGAKAAVELEAK